MKIKKNFLFWLLIFIFLSTYSISAIQKKKILFFTIESINIQGLINVSKVDFDNKSKKLFGQSLIFLNRNDLVEIASEFNFIKEIKIKKIYPNTLNIIITENKPLGIFNEKDQKILLLESGKTVSNYNIKEGSRLINVKGTGAKKKFYKFYKILEKTNFEIDLIEELNYHNIDRWDIVLKDGKTAKLPTESFESSIEKFISIYDKDNFNNFKIFDFRVNGQLILE